MTGTDNKKMKLKKAWMTSDILQQYVSGKKN
jgi:hypothetical protein